MRLFIGNKNYSSWSLRPWLLMRHTGIAFDEVQLRLDFSEGSTFKSTVAGVSPAGKVPVLVEADGFAVWDTLAIAEYLAEKFPQHALWPLDRQRRARARSLSAEMHGGFTALRQHCPMNIEADLPEVGQRLLDEFPAVGSDLTRIGDMWREARVQSGGPFLFGDFSIADAYFAPVCSRIQTYGLPIAPEAPEVRDYVDLILGLPAMQAWRESACLEHDFIAEDEPYRDAPTAAGKAGRA